MLDVIIVLSLWGLFGGSHLTLSSRSVRSAIVGRLGRPAFLGVYSAVAVATLTPLIWFYAGHKHAGPQVWTSFGPYLLARDLNLMLMLLAFVVLLGGLATPPPSSLLGSRTAEPRGMTRITRHPTFAAVFLFGIAHCLEVRYLGDLVFFGGFSAFAWLGAWHQDTRKLVEVPGYDDFKATTSFVPFAAIVRGQQPLRLGELDWRTAGLAIVLFYLIRAYHPNVFGGILMTL